MKKEVVIEIHSEMNDDFEYQTFRTVIGQVVETEKELVYLNEGDEFEDYEEVFEEIVSWFPDLPFEPYQIYVDSVR